MNKVVELLNKIKNQTATWKDYSHFLKLDSEYIEPFLNFAEELKSKYFGDVLKIYIPSIKFPAISITGNYCALNCEHCNKNYLKGMKQILTNEDLEKYLLELDKKGANGILLSGGCNTEGAVPLLNFLDSVKRIKNQTKLIINVHTGLPDEQTIMKLAEVKVDIVSFDVVMDEDIIKKIYHLEKSIEDYKNAIRIFKEYKLNIVPHICIGLYYGKLNKELDALKYIKESGVNPNLIVLIALIPPKIKNTEFKAPTEIDIARIIALVRFIFPRIEISLGCMRPKGKNKVDLEKYAIRAGITRIEIPSTSTLKWLKSINPEFKFKFFSACCAVPQKYENKIQSSNHEIKRYLSI